MRAVLAATWSAAALLACGDNAPICVPVAPSELAAPPCTTATCVDMFVVAHEDDDLLFANPDIAGAIGAGHRVVVIYVTAGELGAPGRDQYWLDRERGILNAYAFMAGATTVDRYVAPSELPPGWTFASDDGVRPTIHAAGVELTELDLAPAISVVFVRLGDYQEQCLWEDTNGCSTFNTNPPAPPYVAVTKACPGNGATTQCPSELAAQDVTRDQLVAIVEELLVRFAATSLGTLDSTNLEFDALGEAAAGYHEYWDHYFSALTAITAASRAQPRLTARLAVAAYRGYTISRELGNVSDGAACTKLATFAHYALFDTDVSSRRPTPDNFLACPDCYVGDDYRLSSATSWQRREYAARTVGDGASGRLATPAGCLAASGGALAFVDCATAPAWTVTAANELAQSGSCVAIAIDGGHVDAPAPICGDAPCAPLPVAYPPEPALLVPCPATPGVATTLFVFDNGQIRTPDARCLSSAGGVVTSADCDHVIGSDGHVTGHPPPDQTWTLR